MVDMVQEQQSFQMSMTDRVRQRILETMAIVDLCFRLWVGLSGQDEPPGWAGLDPHPGPALPAPPERQCQPGQALPATQKRQPTQGQQRASHHPLQVNAAAGKPLPHPQQSTEIGSLKGSHLVKKV